MAGLPQGGETPLGFVFFKPKFTSLLSPLSLSGDERFLQLLFVEMFSLSYQNHHVNRALDVETCCAENKCKIFVKIAILPRRRSEKLKEHAWIDV